MHHFKSRGKRKTRNVCKNYVSFPKSVSKFTKVWGTKKYSETEGNEAFFK